MEIILASGSPRRKELLSKLLDKYQKTYLLIPSSADENYIKRKHLSPDVTVQELSLLKANDVFEQVQNNYLECVVIGSDTLVAFENDILGKPEDKEDAKLMLSKLQGKVNSVYTGMTVIIKRDEEVITKTVYSKSDVKMIPMSEDEIHKYIATGEPMDKAGAYAIQGIGNNYIESYTGDFDTIVGLDIGLLEKILLEFECL